MLREKNEDPIIEVDTANITKSAKKKKKKREEALEESSRREFVVTIDQPKDRWYMRFGSEFGLTQT